MEKDICRQILTQKSALSKLNTYKINFRQREQEGYGILIKYLSYQENIVTLCA